jgi:hypothetical protein
MRWLVYLAVLVAVALAIACGPSFQAVYEGDVQFEHCYAIDESSSAPMKEKAECWRDWTRNYTYGQTRDRVEYAVSRHYALTVAPTLPTDDVLQQSAPGGGFRKNLISAPAPTSVFAPPPNTMPVEHEDGGAHLDAGPTLAKIEIRAPGAACTDACEQGWQGCKSTCGPKKVCAACDTTHAQCMIGCYSDGGAAAPGN